jgi:hypothetical protein
VLPKSSMEPRPPQIEQGVAACRFSHTKRGQPIGLAPFEQQSVVDYFFLEEAFLAGVFFLLSGGGSSALAEAV